MKHRLKLVSLWALAACAIAFAPRAAYAHVRVFTETGTTAKACDYQKFVVRVPVEKRIATTEIRLTIPRDVLVYATEPKAGWQVRLERDRGRIVAIDWSGGRLLPHEFDEFEFLASTPKKPELLDWNADQTYEDRSVVRWTGGDNSDTPHSHTTIVANPVGCKGIEK
jgi:uncharacterized protein YcnI